MQVGPGTVCRAQPCRGQRPCSPRPRTPLRAGRAVLWPFFNLLARIRSQIALGRWDTQDQPLLIHSETKLNGSRAPRASPPEHGGTSPRTAQPPMGAEPPQPSPPAEQICFLEFIVSAQQTKNGFCRLSNKARAISPAD